jgi:hypothetical protein
MLKKELNSIIVSLFMAPCLGLAIVVTMFSWLHPDGLNHFTLSYWVFLAVLFGSIFRLWFISLSIINDRNIDFSKTVFELMLIGIVLLIPLYFGCRMITGYISWAKLWLIVFAWPIAVATIIFYAHLIKSYGKYKTNSFDDDIPKISC